MSPPTRFSFHACMASVPKTARPRMHSRNRERSAPPEIRSPAEPTLTSHWAHGSRPRRRACLRAPGWDQKASVGIAEQRGVRSSAPRAGARSEAAISSKVPPRWTVPARRQSAGTPRNWLAQRPVHFEDTGTVAVALKLPAKRRLDLSAAQSQQLPGGYVQESQVTMAQRILKESTRALRWSLYPRLFSGRATRASAIVLCPTLRNWPSYGMAGNPQHQRKGGG